MLHRYMSAAGLAALAMLFTPVAIAARSYDNCTGYIDSIPATISTQGTWCLRQDLTTTLTNAKAITVANSNVTVDCNDFKIGGLSAGSATESTGIWAADRFNLTVRNCGIRGFIFGIHLVNGSGHLIEDNRLDSNYGHAIWLQGTGSSTIRRNFAINSGGSTRVVPNYNIGSAAIVATDADVLDNTVDGVSPSSNTDFYKATGISVNGPIGATVSGNRVRAIVGRGNGEGIGIVASESVFITGNNVSNADVAIRCLDSTVLAKNNYFLKSWIAGIQGCSAYFDEVPQAR